jgi:predicted acetyltransferase
MKLIRFNKDLDYAEAFIKYAQDWLLQIPVYGEDYSKLYASALDDYDAFLTKLIALSEDERLAENKPYVRFYWFLKDANEIVGTIRYRVNIPEEYGNIGYEISSQHRNKGFGKLMLQMLLEQLKQEGIENVILTTSKENIPSIRTIEFNAGVYVGEIFHNDEKRELSKFEIVIV